MATDTTIVGAEQVASNKRQDFIKHGSAQHAALIGLVLDKDHPLGYRLADMTMFGPQATKEFLEEVLRQKVSELKSGPPAPPQSKDPSKPNYAPPLWEPTD